jgi:hypothetical protein
VLQKNSDENHECTENEKCCIYGFEQLEIFKKLFRLGKRVIVYEAFFPQDDDVDKVRGRGGYFTSQEWMKIFKHLSKNYEVKFLNPQQFHVTEKTLNNVDSILRKVDYFCFYVGEHGV